MPENILEISLFVKIILGAFVSIFLINFIVFLVNLGLGFYIKARELELWKIPLLNFFWPLHLAYLWRLCL